MTTEFLITHSEEFAKIAEAFIEAQKNFGEVVKDKTADVKMKTGGQYSYTYADLGKALDAVLPALHEQGIGVLQGPGNSDDNAITVETLLLHKSGEWMRNQLTMRPTSTDPQGAGSAITYVRRYSLMAMCGLAAEDDDGAAASKKDKPSGRGRGAAAQPPAPSGNNALLTRAVELGVIPDDDRLKFKAWAREKVPGCANLQDTAPLTPLHTAAIEKMLTDIEATQKAATE